MWLVGNGKHAHNYLEDAARILARRDTETSAAARDAAHDKDMPLAYSEPSLDLLECAACSKIEARGTGTRACGRCYGANCWDCCPKK